MIFEKLHPAPTTVILMNGPPGSGKDEAASYLCGMYPDYVNHVEFKAKLYNLVMEIYSVDPVLFWEIYDDRKAKDTPHEAFGGISARDAMIYVSEKVIKPNYGHNYFGDAFVKSLWQTKINVASDSGFIGEARPVMDAVGAENVVLVHLMRPGHTFDKDSRDYLDPNDFKRFVRIDNDGTLEEYYQKLHDMITTSNL